MERGTAVVTGASSGIGAATAIALAEQGFHVVAAARRTDRLAALAASHPSIEPVELDVTSQASVDGLAAHLAGRDVTVLVANAGGAFDAATVAEADLDIWQRTHDVNVLGTVRTVRALLPSLIACGRGLVVLMGSTAGRTAYETGGSYAAAKHAVAAIAGTLRLELCGAPVRITEMAPGMVRTDEFALTRFAGDAVRAAKVYEGVAEPLTADDVGNAVAWVATLPPHVNIDLMVMRPVAQAAQHKVHRVPSGGSD
ncbi:MAG: SDR family NAD(P)-dependent oxidoreductase [Actinomycetota bacterium]|nr:SDR family NAD(P)-dependent oxidoreductase [Actinomycetota bacterium]